MSNSIWSLLRWTQVRAPWFDTFRNVCGAPGLFQNVLYIVHDRATMSLHCPCQAAFRNVSTAIAQGDLKSLVQDGRKARVAVLGASGYTGAEVIRLCSNHPHIDITALTAERAAGKQFADVFPSLAPAAAGEMIKIGDVNFGDVDAVFCCLPHATTQEVRSRRPTPMCGAPHSSVKRMPRLRWYPLPPQHVSTY